MSAARDDADRWPPGSATAPIVREAHGEVTLDVPRERIADACAAAREAGYDFLVDLAATDYLGFAGVLGFRDVVRAAGRDSGLVAYGSFTRESGWRGMQELLAQDASIDGVLAAGDVMALGVQQALHESGRKIPGDVAVIGFDDIELAEYRWPPLTTVHQPVQEQARLAVQALLQQVAGEPAPESAVLRTSLVVRGSG